MLLLLGLNKYNKLISPSIAVLGNTTSPASDLTPCSHLYELDSIIREYADTTFGFQMCPTALFGEIVEINRLRAQAAKHEATEADALSLEAYTILERIHNFSSEHWASSKPASKEDWILIGNIYQAAVAIYCISSLQSLLVLPLTYQLRARCAAHGEILHNLLNEALVSPKIKRFMLWPLVVLGAEATNAGAEMRSFVANQLPGMGSHTGSYVPHTAKMLLERFWASGETNWDACFDRPYVFATQIGVDLRGVSPPLS